MAKKEEEIYPQAQDPFILMKQQHEILLQRLDSLDAQVGNLQETWARILNVAQEQPMRPTYQQPQYQQPYLPPQYQEPTSWQQYPQQQPPYPYNPQQQGLPIDDGKPKWEKETAKKPKGKLGRGRLFMLVAVVLIIIVYMLLRSQGYGCSMPWV